MNDKIKTILAVPEPPMLSGISAGKVGELPFTPLKVDTSNVVSSGDDAYVAVNAEYEPSLAGKVFGFFFEGMSVETSQNDGTVQVNMPDYLLQEIYRFASKEGISLDKVPEIVFQIVKGEVVHPETGELVDADKIREWGFQKIFEGDVAAKLKDKISTDPRLQQWFSQNQDRIIDNFKNNFNSFKGLYLLSILTLMGMGELASLLDIEDPTVRLAFVLGPLKPINAASAYIYQHIRSKAQVKLAGYKTFNFFRPRTWMVPVEKVELPLKVETGSAISAKSNLVAMRFYLNGQTGSQFFRGLVQSVLPQGETALIRAGKVFVGVIKFPAHIFNEFSSMGCGVATQILWSQTIGQFIPSDFLYGIPKHFFEITALMAPYMLQSFAGANLKPIVSKIVSHPAFGVVGRGVALDLAAIASTWLVNLGDERQSKYVLSQYIRSAENSSSLLKAIPGWVPFKMYLSTMIGALNKYELERIEELDGLLRRATEASLKQGIRDFIEPELEGLQWLDFARQDGFYSVDLDDLETVGVAKKKIKDFEDILKGIRLLKAISDTSKHSSLYNCFNTSFLDDVDEEEIKTLLSSTDIDNETFLKDVCSEQTILDPKFYKNNPDYVEKKEGKERLLIWAYDAIDLEDAKQKMYQARREKFAESWIEVEFRMLKNSIYLDIANEKLEVTYGKLRELVVDSDNRTNPYWLYAYNQAKEILTQIPFSEDMIEILEPRVKSFFEKMLSKDDEEELELCTYVFMLEFYRDEIQKRYVKSFEEIKALKSVLKYVSPSSSSEVAEQYDEWSESVEYKRVIVDFASERTKSGHIKIETVAFIKEQLNMITEDEKSGVPVRSQWIDNLRLVYPELIEMKQMIEDDAEGEDNPYNGYYEGIVLNVESVLQKYASVESAKNTQIVIKERCEKIEGEIENAFVQLGTVYILSISDPTTADYNNAFDDAWEKFKSGTELEDIALKSKQLHKIDELAGYNSHLLDFDDNRVALRLKTKVVGRIREKRQELLVSTFASDLKKESAKTVKNKLDNVLAAIYDVADNSDGKKSFDDIWSMVTNSQQLNSVKREVCDLVAQYYFYASPEKSTLQFNPAYIDVEGILKEIEEIPSWTDSGVVEHFSHLKSDMITIHNYLASGANKQYMYFISRLMNAVSSEVSPMLSMWGELPVDANEYIKNEFFEILGGEIPVEDAIQNYPEEMREKVRTAIYDYDDYGHMDADGDGTVQNGPKDILHQKGIGESKEAALKMMVVELKFKLAWRAAELMNNGLLSEEAYKEHHLVISGLNKLEMGAESTEILIKIRGLVDNAKYVTIPSIIELFKPNCELINQDTSKLGFYSKNISK